MKKIILILVCAMCMVSACDQTYDRTERYMKSFADNTQFDIRKFKPFPTFEEEYKQSRWILIDAIKPDSGYVYWECRYFGPDEVDHKGKTVVYNGDQSYAYLASDKQPAGLGFFIECLPNVCFSYIVAVREDKTVDLIDSEEKLIKFMGAVDNIEEVLLQIRANGYGFDRDALIGGAYREEEDRYLLYLLEYSRTPVTYRSVKAILYKNGKFIIKSKVTYKKMDIFVIS